MLAKINLDESPPNQIQIMTLLSKSLAIRLALSIFLAHIFASVGQDKGPWEIINTKGYFAALLIGTVCSMLISFVIMQVTTKLNNRKPWKEFPVLRPSLQLFFGVLFPFGLIFVLITIYFALAHIWILDSGWLKHCAAYVFIALLFGNIGTEMIAPKLVAIPLMITEDPIPLPEIKHKVKMFKEHIFTELIYMKSEDRDNLIMFNDGIRSKYHETVTATLKHLNEDEYINLGRAGVVRLSAIYKARLVGPRRNKLKIFLNGHDDLKIILSEDLTREHKELFKQYLSVD
ncbi:MAG: hypothetical protein H7202_09715 [Pedobacter sp.]|nr:hypothetical protein [Pedobacter sp.]